MSVMESSGRIGKEDGMCAYIKAEILAAVYEPDVMDGIMLRHTTSSGVGRGREGAWL